MSPPNLTNVTMTDPDSITRLQSAKRVVIKIGSSLLVNATGKLRQAWLNALADDIAMLKQRRCDVLVVSSGAIAVGRYLLGLGTGKLDLEKKQAAAAVGQIRLAHAYATALSRHKITVAQILLTPSDTEERRRHLNARNTISQLIKLGVVPVINENDTVATQEIRYGDNDRLAARVASMVSADILYLFSDIDGLYDSDPRHNKNARHLAEIAEITADIDAMAGDVPVGLSSGGMVTKLAAGRIATAGGCSMVIAKAVDAHPIKRLEQGARYSWFATTEKPHTARKKWIVGALAPTGHIVIDAGAETALKAGKSLLPAGITAVAGDFLRGGQVAILAPDGRLLGHGISAYSARDARVIMGRQSQEIEKILGFSGRNAIIHSDDLALL